MKCAIFEEHSSSCVVYFRFSGTLFPVSMIDGETGRLKLYKTDFSICGPNIFSVAKWPAVSSSPSILMTHIVLAYRFPGMWHN